MEYAYFMPGLSGYGELNVTSQILSEVQYRIPIRSFQDARRKFLLFHNGNTVGGDQPLRMPLTNLWRMPAAIVK
ncbi:hypothetical protein D3C75_715590 [compost metagenome]